MKPKIVSWNVRGLNEADKYFQIKNLLHEWKRCIVCFQKTKLKYIPRNIVRSLWSCTYVGWAYLVSNGVSGGVLEMWYRRVMEKIEKFIGDYIMACSFKNVDANFLWAFAGVYGLN